MAAPKRAKPINFKLRIESQERFDELHAYRMENGGNANKSDMMSQAIDMLYEKELGRFKPKEKNGK